MGILFLYMYVCAGDLSILCIGQYDSKFLEIHVGEHVQLPY